MPSTITAYTTFVAGNTIKSSEVNANLSNHRGTLVPINSDTATASDGTHDLGSTEHKWNNAYINKIVASTIASAFPSWVKYSITHTSLQAATTTSDIELFSQPANGVIQGVLMSNVSAFTGTSYTNYELSVGITGDLEKYANYTSGYTSTVSEAFTVLGFESLATSTSIRLQAKSTGGNLDASTAGSIDVWVLRATLE